MCPDYSGWSHPSESFEWGWITRVRVKKTTKKFKLYFHEKKSPTHRSRVRTYRATPNMIATIAVSINTSGTTITDNCDCFFTSYVLIPSTLRAIVTSLRTMISTVCIFSSSNSREMTISGVSVLSHKSHISSPVVLYAPFLMSKQYSYGRDPFQVTDKWRPSSWRIHNEPDIVSVFIGSKSKWKCKKKPKNDN